MPTKDDYIAYAREQAQSVGLDPDIFQRQIEQESGFNPNRVSPAGAVGIAQLVPDFFPGAGVDPFADLRTAARLMAGYVKQYGSIQNALIAYNAGPGRLQRILAGAADLPRETADYLRIILGGVFSKSGTSVTEEQRSRERFGGPSTPAEERPSQADIQAWAQGIGQPVELGQAFVKAFGRLPQTLEEYVNWRDAGRALIGEKAQAAPDPLAAAINNVATAVGSLTSIGSRIAEPFTGFFKDIHDLGQFLGQPNLLRRFVLGLFGLLLIFLGLIFLGISFIPKGVSDTAGKTARLVATRGLVK